MDSKKNRAIRAAKALSKASSARSKSADSMRRKFQNNIVPRASGHEMKQVVTAITTASTAGAFTVIPLNLIATGDDFNSRDGRSILAKSLRIRGKFTSAESGTPFRVCVIMDRGTGSLPTGAEIFRTGTAASDAFNLDNRDRFTVIKDWFPYAGTNTNDTTCIVDWYLPFPKDVECKYTSTSANQGSLGSNAIYIVYGSSVIVTPSVMQCDFRFKDI